MSCDLVPPYVCDAHPQTEVERRLAARYHASVKVEQVSKAQELATRRARKALLARVRDLEKPAAYNWLADALLDPPSLLRDLRLRDLLESTVGDGSRLGDFAGVRLGRLEGWEARLLSESLRGRARRRAVRAA